MTMFKILGDNFEPVHGGKGAWIPGEVRKLGPGEIRLGYFGLSMTDIDWLVEWAFAWRAGFDLRLFEIVPGDELYEYPMCWLAREATLGRQIGVLTREVVIQFAIRCAERIPGKVMKPADAEALDAVINEDLEFIEAELLKKKHPENFAFHHLLMLAGRRGRVGDAVNVAWDARVRGGMTRKEQGELLVSLAELNP